MLRVWSVAVVLALALASASASALGELSSLDELSPPYKTCTPSDLSSFNKACCLVMILDNAGAALPSASVNYVFFNVTCFDALDQAQLRQAQRTSSFYDEGRYGYPSYRLNLTASTALSAFVEITPRRRVTSTLTVGSRPLAVNLTVAAPAHTFELVGDTPGNYTFVLEPPRGPLGARVRAYISNDVAEVHGVAVGELAPGCGSKRSWANFVHHSYPGLPNWKTVSASAPPTMSTHCSSSTEQYHKPALPESALSPLPLWPNLLAAPYGDGGAELWWISTDQYSSRSIRAHEVVLGINETTVINVASRANEPTTSDFNFRLSGTLRTPPTLDPDVLLFAKLELCLPSQPTLADPAAIDDSLASLHCTKHQLLFPRSSTSNLAAAETRLRIAYLERLRNDFERTFEGNDNHGNDGDDNNRNADDNNNDAARRRHQSLSQLHA